jgi:aminopeptidase N
MENASAIFYFEGSIKCDRTIEALLTHEIAHQWFGNSATEKEWNDVWLSEGFATYMTHAYLENKYGTDTLTSRMKTDRDTVVGYSKMRNKPVVLPQVTKDLMQLLDINAYQKGGWVLHMLRSQLGESVFWKGIQNYYAAYGGKNASTEDFRKIMEKASGKDLSQFFTQWLYTSGQPELDVTWNYDMTKKIVSMTILQKQAKDFSFPLEILIHAGKQEMKRTLMITRKTSTINISSPVRPDRIDLDPNVHLLFTSNL